MGQQIQQYDLEIANPNQLIDSQACSCDSILLRYIGPTLIFGATGAASVFLGSLFMSKITKDDAYQNIATSQYAIIVFGATSCALAWPGIRSSVRHLLDLKAGNVVISRQEGQLRSNFAEEFRNHLEPAEQRRDRDLLGIGIILILWLFECLGPVSCVVSPAVLIIYYCVWLPLEIIGNCLKGMLNSICSCAGTALLIIADCLNNHIKPLLDVSASLLFTFGYPLAMTAAFAYGKDFVAETQDAPKMLKAFWLGEVVVLPALQIPAAYGWFKKVIEPLDAGTLSPTRFFNGCCSPSRVYPPKDAQSNSVEGEQYTPPPPYAPSAPAWQDGW